MADLLDIPTAVADALLQWERSVNHVTVYGARMPSPTPVAKMHEPGGLPQGWLHVAGLHKARKEHHLVVTACGWGIAERWSSMRDVVRCEVSLHAPTLGEFMEGARAIPAPSGTGGNALFETLMVIAEGYLPLSEHPEAERMLHALDPSMVPLVAYRPDLPARPPKRPRMRNGYLVLPRSLRADLGRWLL